MRMETAEALSFLRRTFALSVVTARAAGSREVRATNCFVEESFAWPGKNSFPDVVVFQVSPNCAKIIVAAR